MLKLVILCTLLYVASAVELSSDANKPKELNNTTTQKSITIYETTNSYPHQTAASIDPYYGTHIYRHEQTRVGYPYHHGYYHPEVYSSGLVYPEYVPSVHPTHALADIVKEYLGYVPSKHHPTHAPVTSVNGYPGVPPAHLPIIVPSAGAVYTPYTFPHQPCHAEILRFNRPAQHNQYLNFHATK